MIVILLLIHRVQHFFCTSLSSVENHCAGSYRDRVPQVQQLLLRHAPALAASPEKQAFLQDRLGLPPAWIAEALTVWARYNRDTAGTTSVLNGKF